MASTHPHPSGARRPASVLVPALALVLAGCHATIQSDYREHRSAVNAVTVPDSAAVGASFSVSISTTGPNGCWRKGNDAVKNEGGVVRIAPYDREYHGVCTQSIVTFQHLVPITPTTRGKLEINVQTRVPGASGKDSTGVITKYVRVY